MYYRLSANLEEFVKKYIIWLLIFVGLSLFIIGQFNVFGLHKGASELLKGLGNTILASGIFSAVLKSFQFLGIFEEEIVKILRSPSNIEHVKAEFSKLLYTEDGLRYVEIQPIWRELTRQIYENKFPKISDEISAIIVKQYLPVQHLYYYEDFRTSISVRLISDDYLDITETSEFIIVPSEPSQKVSHVYKAGATIESDKSELSFFKLKSLVVDGEEYRDSQILQSTEYSEKDRQMLGYSLDLLGSESYNVKREFKKRYPLKGNSVKQVIGADFMKRVSVHVSFSDNMNVYFHPVGTPQQFRDRSQAHDDFVEFECREVLFPFQGYRLTFEKKRSN